MSADALPQQLVVNGRPLPLPSPPTLDSLLDTLGLDPRSLVIEHNGIALLRSEITSRPLSHGDRLEILKISAGG